MAKWERNRVMYFGAQSLDNITEKAEAVSDNPSLTVAVAAEDFGEHVNNVTGEYTLICEVAGNTPKWTLNTAEVNMTAYGVTVTGTPAVNDAIVVQYTAASSPWEALGKDNDDLSKELNADTETSKNVLGESTFTHSGFEPEISIDPYYIDPGRKLYKWVRDIAMNEKYAESECVGYFAECYFTLANKEKQQMIGVANVRKAWFIPQSIGGDTAGAAVPINVNPFGPVTKYNVVYNMANNEPTFTKANEETAGG